MASDPPQDSPPLLPKLPGIDEIAGAQAPAETGRAPESKANVKAEFESGKAVAVPPTSATRQDVRAEFDGASGARPVLPAASGEDMLAPGREFHGYELVEKIGQGGMGLVFKGRQISLDRVVAIKILNKALYDNQEFIKRFQREAKSIARVNHPNIVGVYDFGQVHGLWFMVNEFVEGQSLAKIISDRLMIPPNELVPIMAQCLAGLHHVAQLGIIHRDIKPDNILITRENVAKIADFGLAKDVSSQGDTTDLTAVGLAMGTPAYMSPEQCMGRKLDTRSDIYSFGVTAYFALTGEKPFTGQSPFEIMTRQREHLPPAPHLLVPSLPREVSELVMRMLAKSAQDRHENAEVCRQAWLEAGMRIGVLRSGEYDAMALERGRTTRLVPVEHAHPPAPAAPPLPPQPVAPAEPPPPNVPSIPPPPGPPPRPQSSGEHPVPAAARRIGTESHAAAGDPKSSPARVATDRRSREPAPPANTATCPRCGHLNRSEAAVCGRCGAPLREADTVTAKGQAAEAQRLFDQGRFRESADLWAALADKEPDRVARSVLRSKEREARKQAHEHQLNDLLNRARSLAGRGDFKGAVATLEQGRDLFKDASASTSAGQIQLERELAGVRQHIARRRRLATIAILLALLGLAVAAWFILHGRGAPPAQPATLAVPAGAP